jgi:hypothetical protein
MRLLLDEHIWISAISRAARTGPIVGISLALRLSDFSPSPGTPQPENYKQFTHGYAVAMLCWITVSEACF